MNQFNRFSEATELEANMAKCKVYLGGVEESIRKEIMEMTGFSCGNLPFKYLGIPLDCKKITMASCSNLIEKIVGRIKHWSGKLLTYAGRAQLIKSVIESMTTYWLHVYPLPKKILKYIESVCRSFLWTGKESISHKALVAWQTIYQPVQKGGLQIMNMIDWRQALCAKMLWNLSCKADKLWVKWVHMYFMNQGDIDQCQVKSNMSWILKSILKCREEVRQTEAWQNMDSGAKFETGKIYREIRRNNSNVEEVPWRRLLLNSVARPRSKFILWLVCHRRLYTKDRLQKFGLTTDGQCCLCEKDESVDHLFFECDLFSRWWTNVLRWMKYDHCPGQWKDEINWIMKAANGSRQKNKIMRCAVAETVYEVWRARNHKIFREEAPRNEDWRRICNVIAVRCANSVKLNAYVLKFDRRV